MAPGSLKRRGPPLGNQNARKHGFYSSVLSPVQRSLLPRAKSIRGLNDEIGVARIHLASVVSTSPNNGRVLSAAIKSLLRLERTRHDTITRRRTVDPRAAKLRKKGGLIPSGGLDCSIRVNGASPPRGSTPLPFTREE